MEALTAGMEIIQKVIFAIGAGTAAWGAYTFFDGYKSENSADKDKGLKQLISGGGFILVAQTLIPMITNSLK